MQFGVSQSDSAEASNRGDQSFFFPGEDAILPRIDKDGSVRARGAEGRGDQHAWRNQIPQRMDIGADRERNGLSGRDGALSQISRKAQGLAVMAGPRSGRKLRSLG